jgi:hypothetical protein
MIQFFVDHDGAFGIRSYLTYRGAPLAEVIKPVEYEILPSIEALPATTAIFAGVDQIGPTGRSVTSSIGHSLRERGLPVLNDPQQVLLRYDLLQTLRRAGINRFDARRASGSVTGLRYPVFVRQEHRHNASLTDLLPDSTALRHAISELVLRGHRRQDLIVIEFCDARSPDGLFRKYSAMRVGDRMLPRHLHITESWISKSDNSVLNDDTINEERRYFDERPHDAWLWGVFQLARIEFGRIDYGIANGVPQVWEINTNPTLGRNDRMPRAAKREAFRPALEKARLAFHTEFIDALRAVDVPDVGLGELPIVIAPSARRRMAAERRKLQWALTRIRVIQNALDFAPVQRLRRVLAPVTTDIVRAVGGLHERRAHKRSEKPLNP